MDSIEYENIVPELPNRYAPYAEIVKWMQEKIVRSKQFGLNANIVEIFKTSENRIGYAFYLTKAMATNKKKSVFICGGQHGREYLAITTALWFINEFVTNRNYDDLLLRFQFCIIPVANPDGYEFVQKGNYDWRKNRRLIEQNIYGVDLNRNWEYGWLNGLNASSESKDDGYKGSESMSEAETLGISFVLQNISNLVFALDIHSYAQMVLTPYAYKNTVFDAERTKIIVKNLVEYLKEKNYVYIAKHAYKLYATIDETNVGISGSLQDYVVEKKHCPCYVIELPPEYSSMWLNPFLSKFQPPMKNITPVGESIIFSITRLLQNNF